jgi:hypothetical protein
MNKSEKAIVALLTAQLEVMLANAEQKKRGKADSLSFAKKTALARKAVERYRVPPLGKPARKKARK